MFFLPPSQNQILRRKVFAPCRRTKKEKKEIDNKRIPFLFSTRREHSQSRWTEKMKGKNPVRLDLYWGLLRLAHLLPFLHLGNGKTSGHEVVKCGVTWTISHVLKHHYKSVPEKVDSIIQHHLLDLRVLLTSKPEMNRNIWRISLSF